MINTVFFDFDGVLTIDSTGSKTTIDYICSSINIDRDLFAWEYRKYGRDLLLGKTTHEEIWPKVCSALGVDIDYQLLLDSFIYTKLDKTMMKLVKDLKSLGIRTGIITDNKKDRMKSIIDHYNLEEFFNEIVISAVVGSMKDQEDIFVIAAKEIGSNYEDIIFIDNNERNLIKPRDLGMKTYYFNDIKRDADHLRTTLKINGIQL